MATRKKASKSNSHKAKYTMLSKKIDKKLLYVAETFEHSLGNNHIETHNKLFWKRLLLKDIRYLTFLDLKYNFENRFVAISYNLELSCEIQTDQRFQESGSYVFEVTSQGKMNVDNAVWICTTGPEDTKEKDRCLERLNNPLILNRILSLDLQKIQVSHEKDSNTWQLRCESMIGSATWILIPPVINLVKPSPEECIQFIEFFELVADAVANNT